MDERVLETQKWLNETYGGRSGYTPVGEDGQTGSTTVGALIIAVQIELGITNPVPTFGPETARRFPTLRIQSDGAEPNNLNKILQGAFWCKGYSPGGFSGNFYSATERAVKEFQVDVGFLDADGLVDSKLMKVILNTDGFRLKTPEGQIHIRSIQQILNREYNSYFDYIPTNGVYERKTNTAIIYALQHEIGIGDIANGNYGESTILYTPTLSPNNAPENQTRVLQFALAVNGHYMVEDFRGIYNSTVEDGVRNFQSFMTLPATGIADMPTFKQLLTSNGDTGRSAIACDASTIVDNAKAQTLVDNGYEIIGRYLTGNVAVNGGSRSKAMTAEELSILNNYGLRVFPIFQDGRHTTNYFRGGRGTQDALNAVRAASELGFPTDTTIYFSVDYDAYDFEVDGYILPYLVEVKTILNRTGYKLGVYGARNTCIKAMNDTRVRSEHSFVSNMSTGFSGNLGFPMPQNWSFGQFYETSIGIGTGAAIAIDKNDYSGRDPGVIKVKPPNIGEHTEEYNARYEEMKKIGANLPGYLREPGIITTDFEFNRKYNVFNARNIKVDINTATTFSPPESGDESIAIKVTNNTIDFSVEDHIGDLFPVFSSARISFFEGTLNDISATVGNGWIQLTTSGTLTQQVFTITAFKENIPVDGGGEVDLSVSVIYTLDIDTLAPEFGPLKEYGTVEMVLGVAFLVIAIFSAPVATGVAVSVILSFLLGETDDIET